MARILIVDDSATMREILARGIRQAGFDVDGFEHAGDGIEGLEALEQSSVDLILSDVSMPNMNGIEFVRTVRERHGRDVPIVMIANEGLDEIVGEARSQGANGCITKPCSSEQIVYVLSKHLA